MTIGERMIAALQYAEDLQLALTGLTVGGAYRVILQGAGSEEQRIVVRQGMRDVDSAAFNMAPRVEDWAREIIGRRT